MYSLAILVALGVLALMLIYCIYMLYMHPFAKYPGPLSCRLCTARASYHAWIGDLHLDIWYCHQRYGNIVRYGPNALLFNTTGATKDIYLKGHSVTKPRFYQRLERSKANILTILDDKEHGFRQRLLGQGLTPLSLERVEDRMLTHVRNLCASLSSTEDGSWGPPLDMAEWCNYLTFDIMADIVFGAQSGLLTEPANRYLVEDIDVSAKRAFCLICTPLLFIGRMDRWVFPEAVRARRRFLGFVDQLVEQGLAKGTTAQGAIFTSLLSLRDTETQRTLDRQSILSEATALTVAGFDTTAVALCALFFYLSRYPTIYEKLALEIRTQFSSPDSIRSGKILSSCWYLQACIHEVLRISPSVSTGLFRETKPGGTKIDGHFVPGGSLVGTGIYSIHHNPEYFQQPHDFIPERWLDNNDGGAMTMTTHCAAAYMPFSRGARSCLGKSLAYWELLVTIASVIWSYDFRPAPGRAGEVGCGNLLASSPGRRNPLEFQLFDRGTCGKKGPVLQFRRREGSADCR